MPQHLAEQILARISEAGGLYNRLLLVVAPSGAGKTPALREVAESTGCPLINLNLELSRLLLELTERQRCLQVPTLLDDIMQARPGDVVTGPGSMPPKAFSNRYKPIPLPES